MTLLDAEEYEMLVGMVAEGLPLIRILEHKTSALWRERDLKAWFLETRGDTKVDLPFIREEADRGYRAMGHVLRGEPR